VAQQSGKPVVAKLMNDVLDYHATPEEAAQTARDAQVRFLVLNHIVPTLPPLPGMEKVFLGSARDIFKGPIHVGIDGDFVSLPAGSTTITWGNRL
jgi:ribonuclease Z